MVSRRFPPNNTIKNGEQKANVRRLFSILHFPHYSTAKPIAAESGIEKHNAMTAGLHSDRRISAVITCCFSSLRTTRKHDFLFGLNFDTEKSFNLIFRNTAR